MKSLLILLHLLSFSTFAQHAGHQMKESSTHKMGAEYTGKVVEYHLTIQDTIVNYTGKSKKAIAINGQIPGPTIYFQEGDTAIIHVHNQLKTETSTHWHGILLPNEQDGVSYLTTAPIKPNTSHTFKFPIIQSGTYWYHSHTMLQEQSGMYGSIVIYPKEGKSTMREQVLLLSDWTDLNPKEVMRSLKRESDWYAIKKKSVQSWAEAISKGYFEDKLRQEWKRMPPMDIADVYYEQFLVNGKAKLELTDLKGGDKIKLRLINGSASSYFYLHYSGGPIEVIAADGLNVMPVKTNRLLMAVAETYDIVLTVPYDMKYELRITAQDISGTASVWLGSGMEMKATDMPKLNYLEMMRKMGSMDRKGMDMEEMKMSKDTAQMKDHHHPMKMQEHITGEWSYDMLMSPKPTTLPQDNPIRTVHLDVTGNMNRYIWSFNNKPLSKEDIILIRKGENVRFIFNNKTMMNHPLHLHGHFFRVINKHGDHSPLKHTFNIEPMETVIIEFEANAEKDWFFHCHILYHMMSGMARVVRYENSPPNEQLSNIKNPLRRMTKEDNRWFFMGETSIHSQANYGHISLFNIYNAINAEWRVNWEGEYETETHFVRYLDNKQFLKAVVGTDIRLREKGEENTKDNRKVIHIGMQYTLPLFIEAEWRVDHKGELRLQASREDITATNRLRFNWMVNTDEEYLLGLKYIVKKNYSISANYDSDFGLGGGITITY